MNYITRLISLALIVILFGCTRDGHAVRVTSVNPVTSSDGMYVFNDGMLFPADIRAELRENDWDFYQAHKGEIDAAGLRYNRRVAAIGLDDWSGYEFKDYDEKETRRLASLLITRIPWTPEDWGKEEISLKVNGIRSIDTDNPNIADRLYGIYNFGYGDANYTNIFLTQQLLDVDGMTGEMLEDARILLDINYEGEARVVNELFYFSENNRLLFSIVVQDELHEVEFPGRPSRRGPLSRKIEL